MKYSLCKNFPGYAATPTGEIYSCFKNIGGKWQITNKPVKLMSPFLECIGKSKRVQARLCLFIRFNGKRTKRFVHQLVCDAWHTRTNPDQVVLHKNDITNSNHKDNLMFGTKLVNAKQRELNNLNDNYIKQLELKLAQYKSKYGEL
jgi:hypothetical protein